MQIMHFTPPQIAKHFDVNESTVKRWIQSGKLDASYTPGGHYRISREQMDRFISENHKYASSYVLSRLHKQVKQDIPKWREYYIALLRNNTDAAIKILKKYYLSGQSLSTIFDKVIIPTLEHVGSEWSVGNIEVNEEHRMSFFIGQHISILSDFILEGRGTKSKSAILACVPGNSHILPMLMGDVMLKLHNFNREILGINISYDEIEKAFTRSGDIKIICISKTYSELDNIDYLRKIIRISKEYKVSIVLIGLGWSEEEIEIAKKSKVKVIISIPVFESYLKKLA